MKARVIIADDHPMVCQGVSESIARTTDLEVAAIAHDGKEAERLARNIPAELLLLDISLPVCSGVQVLELLRAAGSKLPVLFFSMHSASQYVPYARQAGAQGFIGKDAGEKALLSAMRRIVSGGTSFPSLASPRGKPEPPPVRTLPVLSARENEVLHYLLQGIPLVTIAAELGVSAPTITTYRRRILDKLSVRNNAELILLLGQAE